MHSKIISITHLCLMYLFPGCLRRHNVQISWWWWGGNPVPLPPLCIYTANTSWSFLPQISYPCCRQTEETVVMRGLLWCWRLTAQGNPQAAAWFILQPQYTNNPQNICERVTCLHENSLLQLWSAFVMTLSQMFWVYCGYKRNWAVTSWVALSN